MAENQASAAGEVASATAKGLVEDLRKVEVFADLPGEQLAWLAEHLEVLRFQPG